MGSDVAYKEPIAFFVIINSGMGSKVLKETKRVGVSGGTIFLGKGTVKSHVLELLGLNEAKKEIVLMIMESRLEDIVHETISEKFNLDKPNHGIAFSLPVKSILGIKDYSPSINDEKTGGIENMVYEVIFTIVERGLAEEVINAATSAGSKGATIINARGSGIHEDYRFLSMQIEPEKEIVMIITEEEKTDQIVSAINEAMKIEEPGKGVLFVLDVSKTSGLFSNNN